MGIIIIILKKEELRNQRYSPKLFADSTKMTCFFFMPCPHCHLLMVGLAFSLKNKYLFLL